MYRGKTNQQNSESGSLTEFSFFLLSLRTHGTFFFLPFSEGWKTQLQVKQPIKIVSCLWMNFFHKLFNEFSDGCAIWMNFLETFIEDKNFKDFLRWFSLPKFFLISFSTEISNFHSNSKKAISSENKKNKIFPLSKFQKISRANFIFQTWKNTLLKKTLA